MKVLVCDNHPPSLRMIELALQSAGYVVDAMDDVDDALAYASDASFDAIILGPLDATISALRSARRSGLETPVLFLTFKDSPETLCEGLAVADEVLVKPILPNVLRARLGAVVRRWAGFSSSIITAGGLTLDLARQTASYRDQLVDFTPKEFRIIEALALRADTVLTREMMLTVIYGGRDEPEIRVLDVFMCKVRRKLRAVGFPDDGIETVWGRGWMMPRKEKVQA